MERKTVEQFIAEVTTRRGPQTSFFWAVEFAHEKGKGKKSATFTGPDVAEGVAQAKRLHRERQLKTLTLIKTPKKKRTRSPK